MNLYNNNEADQTIFRVEPLMSTMSFDVKNKELASLFECPVCFDYASPPILQCQSGHIVCSNCRSKLGLCPTCRGPLENIRNLALEKLAMNVMFPCKYSSNGCTDLFPYPKKKQHEEVCDYRPYMCPCPESTCRWMGKLEYVMPHLQQYHKNITSLEGEDIVFLATDITLPGAVDWVMMQSCFGHHFMLVLEKQERFNENRFYAIVRLIGTKKQAKQFAYRLELYNGRRRLTWDATPCSIHDSVQLSIANSDCLILDSSTAHVFAKNGNLGISVTIWHMGSNRRSDSINPSSNSVSQGEEMAGQTTTTTSTSGMTNQPTVVYPGYNNGNKLSRHGNNRTLPIPPPPLSNPTGSPDCITSQTNLVVVSSNNNQPNSSSGTVQGINNGPDAGKKKEPSSSMESHQMDLSNRSPQHQSPLNMRDSHMGSANNNGEMGVSSSTTEGDSRVDSTMPILPAGRPFSLDLMGSGGQGDTGAHSAHRNTNSSNPAESQDTEEI